MAEDTPQPPTRSSADKEKSKQQSRPVTGKDGKPATPPGTAKSSRAHRAGRPPPEGRPHQGLGHARALRPSAKPTANRPAGQKPKSGSAPTGPPTPGQGPGRRAAPPRAHRPPGSPGSSSALVLIVRGRPGRGQDHPARGPDEQRGDPSPRRVFDDPGCHHDPDVGLQHGGDRRHPRSRRRPPPVVTHRPAGAHLLAERTKPGIFFLGGEFCPYCAAQRWVIITALSRFGTFADIDNMQSSARTSSPTRQTFTFVAGHLPEPVRHLPAGRALQQPCPTPGTGYYKILTPFTKEQAALVKKFSTAQFSSAATRDPVPGRGQQGAVRRPELLARGPERPHPERDRRRPLGPDQPDHPGHPVGVQLHRRHRVRHRRSAAERRLHVQGRHRGGPSALKLSQ